MTRSYGTVIELCKTRETILCIISSVSSFRDQTEPRKLTFNMIETKEESRNGWCIVTVNGRADHEAADALESALKSAVEGNARVAADFSGLLYISSAGLRSVVQAARAAQSRGSEFVICGISEMVRKVFDVSGLAQFLQIHGELPC